MVINATSRVILNNLIKGSKGEYDFILQPISYIGWFLMPETLTGITTPLTWEIFREMYPDLIGQGPLWFVAMLLVFSFGYVVWRMVTGD